MTKWADFLISGIWIADSSGSTHISFVLLHVDTETTFSMGTRTSRKDVVNLIKAGKSVKTIMWNYYTGAWNLGADVSYITLAGMDYLRSHKDGTVNDNLDNLIQISHFL